MIAAFDWNCDVKCLFVAHLDFSTLLSYATDLNLANFCPSVDEPKTRVVQWLVQHGADPAKRYMSSTSIPVLKKSAVDLVPDLVHKLRYRELKKYINV